MIILDSLHEDYEYYKITYIKIDNRYNNSYTDLRITKQEYFSFCLADLLPNLKKIINLDIWIRRYKFNTINIKNDTLSVSSFFNIIFNCGIYTWL